MRELLALASRYVLSAVRGRGTAYLGVGGMLAVAFVFLVAGRGGSAPSTLLLGSFLVLGMLAFGVAAWAGGLLPGDREEGRESWLATTAPAGWTRRLAAAASGLVLAVGVALAGALVLGLLLPFFLGEHRVRASRSISDLDRRRIAPARPEGDAAPATASRASLRIDLPPAGSEVRTLELEVRPLYVHHDAVAWTVDLGWAWSADGETGDGRDLDQGVTRIAYGAPVRLEVPAGATSVVLENPNAHAALVLRSAHILGGERSLLATLLIAGLLLGAAAGAMAPVSVAVSRWTSAPTATMAGLVLALAGGFRFVLDDLALPGRGWFHETGLDVVRAATHLAPDLEVLGLLGAPGAGQALSWSDLAGILPLVLYTLVGLLAVAIPFPVEVARGRSS